MSESTGWAPTGWAPTMPTDLAAAIIAVTTKVKRLGADERNQHGGYQYVSVDKFYETIGPLMADAGLFLMVNETSADVREHSGKNGPTAWLYTRYELQFAHKSGALSAPVVRSCALPISGPQAFGSAQSYIEKQFLRQVFKIPTGEKDADEVAQDGSPIHEPPRSIPRMPPEAEKPAYKPEMPHQINFPQLQSGGPDYRRWGAALMTALRAEKAHGPWREWQIVNEKPLGQMKEKEPAQYDKLMQAIDRDGDRFRDLVAAEEAASVIS